LNEKFLRFRRLREHARDLLADKGKITERQAFKELVEEMWNAPLQRKRGTNKMYEEKRFNFPSSNFPAPAAAEAVAANKPLNYNALPDVPNRNVVRPPTTLAGFDAVMRSDEPVVIQFHHTQPDGSVYNHIDEETRETKFIAPETLEGFIESQVANYKTDGFGYCWAYPGDCKGRLHPEEIKPFVPEELYKAYKGKFNWAFGKGGPKQGRGGARQTHKKHAKASRRRRQTAGAPRNIFVPATNAQCNLPRNRRTNRRNNNTRKNNH
jgi:hypothetical protein